MQLGNHKLSRRSMLAGLGGTAALLALAGCNAAAPVTPAPAAPAPATPAATAAGSTPAATAAGSTPAATAAGSTPAATAAGSTPAATAAGSTPAAKAAGSTPTPAPAAAAAQPSGSGVQVRISVWGDVPDKATYDGITAAVNKANPGLTAVGEQFIGLYYDKLQTALAGGTAPDVLYFQGWSWQAYADKAVLVPLDDYISRDKAQAAWPVIDNYVNNEKWHGKTYMSNIDTGSVVMFYNKALFDKFGVAYPKDGWTYEDFLSTVAKMTKTDGGTKYFGFGQAGGWNGAYGRAFAFMRMDGEVEWDTVVEPKKAQFLQPTILSKLQDTVVDVIKNGQCPAPSLTAGGGIALATGTVALTPEGPWYLAQMQGDKATTKGGILFDVVGMPKGKSAQPTPSAEVHGHVLNKASKNQDQAWTLLKYCMTDDAQTIIASNGRMCGTPDTIKRIWVPIAQKAFNFSNGAAFATSQEIGQTPIINGAGANMDAVSQAAGTPLTDAWDAMLNGTSAKDAMSASNPSLQLMLDNYWRKHAATA
jgi:multiple sugar transport system substrate-binding protein